MLRVVVERFQPLDQFLALLLQDVSVSSLSVLAAQFIFLLELLCFHLPPFLFPLGLLYDSESTYTEHEVVFCVRTSPLNFL